MHALFINTPFFNLQFRHKDSAVVLRWSHNLKVPGLNPGISPKSYFVNDFPQISTVKDFDFQLFGVLMGSTLKFDGSPSLFLTSYSNQSDHCVFYQLFEI